MGSISPTILSSFHQREELRVLDRKTKKHLTMNNASYPRDSVVRLYLPRKLGGRGLIAVEDAV